MGPQCAMGLSVMMVFDGHGLFQNLWVLNAPWGCLLLWYFMVMFLRMCGSSRCHGGQRFPGISKRIIISICKLQNYLDCVTSKEKGHGFSMFRLR